ncbi:hypothetical protein FRB94_000735 [Tulasnella sp. JGI-2019a]|nr:hypothetical protein FRB94_000735 [Tulasnella sp. JGI-2019a]KAG8991815.1 hypothetical protein FRB93_002550 [Tulasnella sp. JGI-2019a]KAG9022981.1 hypothetical protein FRB95_013880 [Tulasnella sp. JGI-2019a]
MPFWSFLDFFYLNCTAYSQRIQALSNKELEANILRKLRQMVRNGLCIAGGIGAAPFTHGWSIIGAACSARKLHVAKQKYALLKAEWRRRGLEHISVGLTKWDIVESCAAGVMTGIAAIVVPLMVGSEIMAYVVTPAVNMGIERLFA